MVKESSRQRNIRQGREAGQRRLAEARAGVSRGQTPSGVVTSGGKPIIIKGEFLTQQKVESARQDLVRSRGVNQANRQISQSTQQVQKNLKFIRQDLIDTAQKTGSTIKREANRLIITDRLGRKTVVPELSGGRIREVKAVESILKKLPSGVSQKEREQFRAAQKRLQQRRKKIETDVSKIKLNKAIIEELGKKKEKKRLKIFKQIRQQKQEKSIRAAIQKLPLTKDEKRRLLRGELIRDPSEMIVTGLKTGTLKGRKKQTLLQKIDVARRKPFEVFQTRLEESSEIGEFVRQEQRGGRKVTKQARAALIAAGFGTAGIRALRGVSTVVLTPDEVVKGIATFGKDVFRSVIRRRAVGTVQGTIDEFVRDPVGTTIEFWAAKKVIGAGLKGAGKLTKSTVGKTKLGQSAARFASKTAGQMKAFSRKIPGVRTASNILRATRKLKGNIKKAVFRTKAIKQITKLTRLTRLSKPKAIAAAREIIRKITKNKNSLKKLKAGRTITKKALTKGKSPAKKVLLKRIDRQINSLKRANNALEGRLNSLKVSGAERLTLRREMRRISEGKAKPPKPREEIRIEKRKGKNKIRILKDDLIKARKKLDFLKKSKSTRQRIESQIKRIEVIEKSIKINTSKLKLIKPKKFTKKVFRKQTKKLIKELKTELIKETKILEDFKKNKVSKTIIKAQFRRVKSLQNTIKANVANLKKPFITKKTIEQFNKGKTIVKFKLAGKPRRAIIKGKKIFRRTVKRGKGAIRKGKKVVSRKLRPAKKVVKRKLTRAKKIIRSILRKGDKLDLRLRRAIETSVDRLVRDFVKLERSAKIQTNILFRKIARTDKLSRTQVRNIIKRMNRLAKKKLKPIKARAKLTTKRSKAREIVAREKADIVFEKVVKRLKGAKKTQLSLLKGALKRTKGRITKPITRLIKRIRKRIPIKKVVVPRPRPKGIRKTSGRKRASAKRRFAKRVIEQELKQILIGRKGKVGPKTSSRVKKAFRREIIRQLKEFKNLEKLTPNQIRNQVRQNNAAKQQARLQRAATVDKRVAKKNIALRDSIKSERIVAQARVIRDFRQAQALSRRVSGKEITKKVNNAIKKSKKALEKVDKQGRVLIQKEKPVNIGKTKKAIQNVGKSKTKAQAKQNIGKARSQINQGQKGVLKLVGRAKSVSIIKYAQSLVPVLSGLSVALIKRSARFSPQRQNIGVTAKQKQKPSVITRATTKQKQTQKQPQKIKQVPVVIPDIRIDQLPKQKQTAIINRIILQTLGTAAILRPGGRRIKVPQTRLRGGIANLRKYIQRRLGRKRFIFTPDIYSVIFGIRAKPKERIILLKPGRFFTGLERRSITR